MKRYLYALVALLCLYSTQTFAITVTNTLDNAAGTISGSLRWALNNQSAGDTVRFNLSATDPNHLYYMDDGVPGQVSLSMISNTTVVDPAGADPDWPYSWWRISLTDRVRIYGGKNINGFSQLGSSPNSNAHFEPSNAIHRIQVFNYFLQMESSNSTVHGLNIAAQHTASTLTQAILLRYTANQNTISGCKIGTDISGLLELSNAHEIIKCDRCDNNLFGGYNPSARTIVSGGLVNGSDAGILLEGKSNNYANQNRIINCFIGTNVSGDVAIPNGNGIILRYGQQTEIKQSLISGNGIVAINVLDNGCSQITIQGNRIGCTADGSSPLGNASGGIYFSRGHSSTIGGINPGEGNIIAFNGGSTLGGVTIGQHAGTNISILGNRFYGNNKLGIGLFRGYQVWGNDNCDGDGGSSYNHGQNFPILTNVSSGSFSTTIDGYLNSEPNKSYRLEFFENTTSNGAQDGSGYGEGEHYLGHTYVTTAGNCYAYFSINFPQGLEPGSKVSATATVATVPNTSATHGSTSEFGPMLLATSMSDSLCYETTDTLTIPHEANAIGYNWTSLSGATMTQIGVGNSASVDWTSQSQVNFFDTLCISIYTAVDTTVKKAPVYVSDCGNNIAPVGVNDWFIAIVNQPISSNVLLNDYDPNGDFIQTLTTTIGGPSNGVISLSTNGSFTYQSNPGYSGSDVFEYVVCDTVGGGLCDTALATVVILPQDSAGVNDPPVALNDSFVIGVNQSLNASLTVNDYDPENGPLTLDSIFTIGPGVGSFQAYSNGTFNYSPPTGFTGLLSFQYVVCDTGALCDTGEVRILVTSMGGNNLAPNAVNDLAQGFDSLSGNVLMNDADPEGGTLVVDVGQTVHPVNGTVTILPNGDFIYVPIPGFIGTDQFVYTICDDGNPSECSQATVLLIVEEAEFCLQLTAFLQGPYSTATNQMTGHLSQVCFQTPNSQPYNMAPWHYAGNEEWNNSVSNVVDWMLISVRTSMELDSTIHWQATLLRDDGQVFTHDGNRDICISKPEQDSVWIVVEHRNHMAAMWPEKVGLNGANPIVLDFTSRQSFTLGTGSLMSAGQAVVDIVSGNNVYALYAGDATKTAGGKNDINTNDGTSFFQNVGQFGVYILGDYNLDCDINSNDLPFIINNIGKTSVVE